MVMKSSQIPSLVLDNIAPHILLEHVYPDWNYASIMTSLPRHPPKHSHLMNESQKSVEYN